MSGRGRGRPPKNRGWRVPHYIPDTAVPRLTVTPEDVQGFLSDLGVSEADWKSGNFTIDFDTAIPVLLDGAPLTIGNPIQLENDTEHISGVISSPASYRGFARLLGKIRSDDTAEFHLNPVITPGRQHVVVRVSQLLKLVHLKYKLKSVDTDVVYATLAVLVSTTLNKDGWRVVSYTEMLQLLNKSKGAFDRKQLCPTWDELVGGDDGIYLDQLMNRSQAGLLCCFKVKPAKGQPWSHIMLVIFRKATKELFIIDSGDVGKFDSMANRLVHLFQPYCPDSELVCQVIRRRVQKHPAIGSRHVIYSVYQLFNLGPDEFIEQCREEEKAVAPGVYKGGVVEDDGYDTDYDSDYEEYGVTGLVGEDALATEQASSLSNLVYIYGGGGEDMMSLEDQVAASRCGLGAEKAYRLSTYKHISQCITSDGPDQLKYMADVCGITRADLDPMRQVLQWLDEHLPPVNPASDGNGGGGGRGRGGGRSCGGRGGDGAGPSSRHPPRGKSVPPPPVAPINKGKRKITRELEEEAIVAGMAAAEAVVQNTINDEPAADARGVTTRRRVTGIVPPTSVCWRQNKRSGGGASGSGRKD